MILFAPGAGAPSSSAWMTAWAERLRTLDEVVMFDYAYGKAGKKRPDPHAKLVEAHREAALQLREPRVLIGKSMGSRIGCHVSLEVPVQALVCFGYPLRGQNGKIRDSVLLELRTPILFIQGTRDPLCPLELLADVRSRMQAPSTLHVIETADHSLMLPVALRKRDREAQQRTDTDVLAAVKKHLDQFAAA
jgi:predicted alpha/beta-hydrolase family hydrolase